MFFCLLSGLTDRSLERATASSEGLLAAVLAQAVLKAHADVSLGGHQRKVINRLLDGFKGKLTTSKWAKLAKCSQDTALRDIRDLIDRNVLSKDGSGGRSSSYTLVSLRRITC